MAAVDLSARPRLPIGARIARFEITGILGAGGMGVVYEARDPDLDRPVAIKLIHEPDTQYSLRLLREAHALARLQHPNVIAVHEVGRHDEQVYVAMERVDGVSLDRLDPQPADWREVLRLFIQAGRGLAAAHDKGLVHRDVKPHNLLVGRDGRVRVADFGLVRLAGSPAAPSEPRAGVAEPTAATLDDIADASADTIAAPNVEGTPAPATPQGALGWELTHAAAYLGTPRYMAPEQHLRRSATAQTDQFSFCVALWETLFGEHPFDTESDESWTDVVTTNRRRSVPRGKAPGWLVEALDRGLAIDPAKRHPSMAALVDLLEHTPTRRRRIAFAGGATAALAAAGAVMFFVAREEPINCDRAGESVDRAWNTATRDRVARTLGDRGAPALAEIDVKTASWRAARTDSCRATHERRDQSAQLLDRRARCLDRQLLELGSLVSAIDAGQVPWHRAVDAARALPDAGRCSAVAVASYEPPTGERAQATKRMIADGSTAYLLGQAEEARTLGDKAVTTAREIGDAGLLAEALELHGRATSEIDHVAARRLLEEALTQAARSGNPVIEATVAITLLGQATLEEATGRVSALLPVVTAALNRAAPDRGLLAAARGKEAGALTMLGRHEEAIRVCGEVAKVAEVDVADSCRCHVLSEAKNYKEAIAACTVSLATTERVWGAKHPRVATSMNHLAGVLSSAGEYDRGIELARRALAIDEAVLGEASTSTQRDIGTLAANLSMAGKYKESREVADRGLALLERTPGQTDSMRAQLLSVRALDRLHLGDVDGGRRDAVDALAFGQRAWGPEHPKAVLYHIRIAQSLGGEFGKQDCNAAIQSFTRAAELATKVYGPDSEHRLIGLQGAAACMVELGRAAEAKPVFEQMVMIAQKVDMQPFNVAMIYAAYADCLLALKDRVGARREFGKAREILVKIPEAAPVLKQLDAHVKKI